MNFFKLIGKILVAFNLKLGHTLNKSILLYLIGQSSQMGFLVKYVGFLLHLFYCCDVLSASIIILSTIMTVDNFFLRSAANIPVL